MAHPWVAIQRNPTSGSGTKRAEVLALCTRLRQLGIRARPYSRRERLAARMGAPNGREGLVCLVAAGGDGTIGDLVNRYPDVPLAILPLGTENLLARHLGIPCDGKFVAETIADGATRRIDLGLLNGRRFTLMVTAGFDADVVHRVHSRRKGNIGKWNYVQPIWETLRTYGYPELRLTVEGADGSGVPGTKEVRGRLAVVANVPSYALRLPITPNAQGDDGSLDLCVFERPSGFQMFRYLYKVARRQHEGLPDVRVERVRRVCIKSIMPVPVQCDGDPAGWTPAEISVLPGALTLMVPRSQASHAGSLSSERCGPDPERVRSI